MFFLPHGSLYFVNVIGDDGVVTAGTGLSALLCCDVTYELCGVVIVQELFDWGDYFWG